MTQVEPKNLVEPAGLNFEDKQSLVGFFALLLKIDKRLNPKTYEHNGSTNNADQA